MAKRTQKNSLFTFCIVASQSSIRCIISQAFSQPLQTNTKYKIPLLRKDRAFLHDGARERLVGALSIPFRGLLGSVKWGRGHGEGVGRNAGIS